MTQLVVAVIGPARSGTSCTAGIVHYLGISMGTRLRRPSRKNPKGFFEDRPFQVIVRNPGNRVTKFRAYARQRGGEVIGVKAARLCVHVPSLVSAFPNLKVITVDRPIPEIVASLKKNRRNVSPSFVKRRIQKRDNDIQSLKVDVLRLQYHETLKDPTGTVDKIIAFLGITPTEEQRAKAIEFIDPSLWHNRT
jgi:hypothetical protein